MKIRGHPTILSCHIWEEKEENANKHVIFNSSWPILVSLLTCDQMNSR